MTPAEQAAEAIRLVGSAKAHEVVFQIIGQRDSYWHPLAQAYSRTASKLSLDALRLLEEAVEERVYIYPAAAADAREARRRAEVLARTMEVGSWLGKSAAASSEGALGAPIS